MFDLQMMTIDVAHYVAMLIWVFGNAAWALGGLVFQPYVEGYTDDQTTYHLYPL
jgi:hypothetical protein